MNVIRLKFRTGGTKTIEGVECKRGYYILDIHIEQSIESLFRTFRDGIDIALEEGIGSGHILLDGSGTKMKC